MGLDMYLINQEGKELGYWRKANSIHRWFVENVQDGVDDCGEYKVSKTQLIMLYNLCDKILNDKSLAESLLPSQSGFFFGSVEYDNNYYSDLAETMSIIQNVLKLENTDYIYYNSSW